MKLIKPSDAKSWSLCKRRVWLDNHSALIAQETDDEFEKLIIELGLLHEQSILNQLIESHEVKTANSIEDTSNLMLEQVEIIYQPQLQDKENGYFGLPDFLILNESGDYQAADAKLSLSENKKEIQAQVGLYRYMLGNDLPAIIYLGNGKQALLGDEINSITDKFISEMKELLFTKEQPDVHYSHSKCKICPYYKKCKPSFEAVEALSLLYGVQGRAVDGLNKNSINTITELSESDVATLPDVPYLKGSTKKHRAIQQAKAHLTGNIYKVNDVVLPDGKWVHFDIEDNPLTNTGEKHVYLWGFLVPEYNDNNFEYIWTDAADEDEQGWLEFLKKVEQYKNDLPNLVLAHYSSHERSTIKSYAERYGMERNEIVSYLLGPESPLYDMQKPVKDNLVLPLQGYGLKDICKHKDLVNFQWQDDESGSQWSVVQYNSFLQEEDNLAKKKIKAKILEYNRDDVIATRKLEIWLRSNYIL